MTAVTRPVRRKKPFPWKEALRILVLTLISLLMIFPIFWMISGSLKAPHEVMNKDVFWPAKPYWKNYAIAWKSAPLVIWRSTPLTRICTPSRVLST